jgi:hypothetical protein
MEFLRNPDYGIHTNYELANNFVIKVADSSVCIYIVLT